MCTSFQWKCVGGTLTRATHNRVPTKVTSTMFHNEHMYMVFKSSANSFTHV